MISATVRRLAVLTAALILITGCVTNPLSNSKSKNEPVWKHGHLSEMGPITQQDIDAYIKFQSDRKDTPSGPALEEIKNNSGFAPGRANYVLIRVGWMETSINAGKPANSTYMLMKAPESEYPTQAEVDLMMKNQGKFSAYLQARAEARQKPNEPWTVPGTLAKMGPITQANIDSYIKLYYTSTPENIKDVEGFNNRLTEVGFPPERGRYAFSRIGLIYHGLSAKTPAEFFKMMGAAASEYPTPAEIDLVKMNKREMDKAQAHADSQRKRR